MTNKPFLPTSGSNQQITATTSTAPFNLVAGRTVRLVNKSTTAAEIVNVRFWYSANAAEPATVADFPLMPNTIVYVSKSDLTDRISVRAQSGTPAIEVMVGENGI